MSLAAWQPQQMPDNGKTSSEFKGETWALTPVRIIEGCERFSEEAIHGIHAFTLPYLALSAQQGKTSRSGESLLGYQ